MDWSGIIQTIVSGLVGAIAAVIVARLSKSRQQRDLEAATGYLSLANITADQLEARINLVGKLDEENRKLQNEIYLMKQKQAELQTETETKRAERDIQIQTLETQLNALQAQVDKDARERDELRKKISEFDFKNRVLWQYSIALLEQMKKNNVVPIDPPENLTDPDILKLVRDIKGTGNERSST